MGVILLAALGGGGAVALRSGSVRAAATTLVRRATTQPQPTTWRESPPPSSVLLHVDTTRTLRPISPLIYGVAAAGADELVATAATLNRWGGNPNSRYNWEIGNAWNAARDWEFRNYGSDPATRSAASVAADRFVATNRAYGAASLITVPALGWVARDSSTNTQSMAVPAEGGQPVGDGWSGGVAGYDPLRNREATSIQSFPRKNAPFVDPPDLRDNAVFQDEWIAHLTNQFGPANEEGVRFYAIDNEPDLWSFTHTDVHPVDPNYDEELSTFLNYAEAIKDVDPGAQVLGPSLSGWNALFYSARDRGADRFRTHADRGAHGDVPFLAWWLDQVRQHDQQGGRRTLDVLDVHAYPQGAGVYPGTTTDEATNRLRLRSTRSLWDPTYVDESWIGDAVQLIPRLRRWIDQSYPGTKLAIGEWNWGADSTMNGALAIADVLGIFGREGVDIAAYWTSPHPGSPGANAFAMYTNYDGQGHGFGDLALPATSSAPDDVQVFASRDSRDGATLVMMVNQRPDVALAATVQLDGLAEAASTELFRLSAVAPGVQDAGPQPTSASGGLQLVLPPESISVMRIDSP